ncbi:conserved hypothetical protein [Shewanella sediminis HAW-EB3]|uniref:Uncharacterized protein n=1 Tax=Shewanella sediminis (strain HAW-EB3) TaxID=425104 RepID=A8FVX1_SHESH|nr:transporter substrate-binding domain-containing protein [Shewanella sediminis]ABV36994.1 conserved hypothetical protein [Shewanella sediminis HAW-EB3]
MSKIPLMIVIYTCFAISTAQVRADSRVITLWNYYLSPPFQISGDEGLAFDFVNLLNDEFRGRFVFRLDSLPRARLNKYLAEQKQGLVLFVNWRWMGDGAEANYLWTPPLWQDRNEVISSIENKVVFDGPESLKGLTLVAVRGRKYKSLEPLFARSEITRFNVNREEQALALLLKSRGDLTIQPRSVVMFLLNELNLQNKIYLSPTPFFSFTRHIMLTPGLIELHPELSEFVLQLDTNVRWQNILQKYDLVEETE